MGATAAEIRELCLAELREAEQAPDAAARHHHAGRALALARLARRLAEREAGDEAVVPPADFLEALNTILNDIARKSRLEITDSDAADDEPTS